MDHNLHHPPLHWGYTSTPPQNPWVPPPQTRSLKRTLSESDCDELYSEESSKDQTSFKRTSPGDSDSCQLLTRKKRRGVIEKKRRDRINSSLSELKRLVPSAYEKQGSAKLEKAEILQLTVDHLKSLHAKGLDTIAYDPQRFAMDYHIIGFRECASEVARYLVTIEGMDIQDPLRLRLMSHLQYFVQQRELSAKAGTSPNWSSTSYHQPNYTPPSYQGYPPQSTSSSYIPNLPPPIQPYSTVNPSPVMHHQVIPHSTPTTSTTTSSDSSHMMTVSATHLQHSQQVTPQQQQQQQQSGQSPQDQQQSEPQQHYPAEHHDHQAIRTYVELTGNGHASTSTSTGYGGNPPYPPTGAQAYNTTGGNVNYGGNGAKPYRPWGAEMAY